MTDIYSKVKMEIYIFYSICFRNILMFMLIKKISDFYGEIRERAIDPLIKIKIIINILSIEFKIITNQMWVCCEVLYVQGII